MAVAVIGAARAAVTIAALAIAMVANVVFVAVQAKTLRNCKILKHRSRCCRLKFSRAEKN